MNGNDRHRPKLPFAYNPEKVPVLQRTVDRFLGDQAVQKAMRDIQYNMSDMFRERKCPTNYFPQYGENKKWGRYWGAALDLMAAANQTQKEIAYAGGYKGMIATSQMCEQLGLLLEHGEFKSDMTVVAEAIFAQPLIDSKKRISIHAATGLELTESRTTGEFKTEPDSITKITHGIRLVLTEIGKEHISPERMRRGYSHGVSLSQLEAIWDRDSRKTIQGMDFRLRKLHEYGERTQGEPSMRNVSAHTIATEVFGQNHIKGGNRPAFFTGLPRILGGHGPRHPEGHVIDFQKLSELNHTLAEQITRTIDQIAELLYNFPRE